MIRKRFPDKIKARSMVNAAIEDMKFVDTLPRKVQASQTIIRTIYENFRALGDALMTAKGLDASGDHHFEMIDALVKLQIKTSRPLLLLHELRKLRHNINYEGYIPNQEELSYVLAIKESLWEPLLLEVKRLTDYKEQ